MVFFSELQERCYQASKRAGWWDGMDNIPDSFIKATKISLIHSEISEALEGERKDKMDEHLPHRKSAEVELADAIIRIFDYAGRFGYNLEDAIMEKMEYNRNRADHKPENRAADGGKKF